MHMPTYVKFKQTDCRCNKSFIWYVAFQSSATIIALYIIFSLKLNNANMNARRIEMFQIIHLTDNNRSKEMLTVKLL